MNENDTGKKDYSGDARAMSIDEQIMSSCDDARANVKSLMRELFEEVYIRDVDSRNKEKAFEQLKEVNRALRKIWILLDDTSPPF